MNDSWRYLLPAMRPRQWIKNLFVFIPLIFGQKLFDYPTNLHVLITFLLFSLMASSVYLFNDIVDVCKDRLHPTKRLRPLAANKITVGHVVVALIVLGVATVVASLCLNQWLACLLILYFLLNFLYSKVLKEVVIIDVFCISAFFVIRIVAGTVVAGVELSHWMMFMIVFLSLFLGFQKRRQELMIGRSQAVEQRAVLNQYSIYFLDQIIAVLTSSMLVVYMLYTVDQRTVNLIGSKHLVYTIPFVCYGIFRYLYLVHKHDEGEDPTAVVFSDRMTQINLVLWVLACIGIIYYK